MNKTCNILLFLTLEKKVENIFLSKRFVGQYLTTYLPKIMSSSILFTFTDTDAITYCLPPLKLRYNGKQMSNFHPSTVLAAFFSPVDSFSLLLQTTSVSWLIAPRVRPVDSNCYLCDIV